MEELGKFAVAHLRELGLLVFIAATIGYVLGRGAMALKAGRRIRDLEKVAARVEMSSQEHKRAAQDLYDRAERAEQTVRKLERSLVELPEVAQRLSSVHDLQEIPHSSLELVQEMFDPTYAVFFKTRRGMLVAQSVLGASPFKLGQKIKPGEGIVGLAAVKQLPFTPVDLRFESTHIRHQIAEAPGGDADFSLCLPVMAEHLTIGVILVGPMNRDIPQRARHGAHCGAAHFRGDDERRRPVAAADAREDRRPHRAAEPGPHRPARVRRSSKPRATSRERSPSSSSTSTTSSTTTTRTAISPATICSAPSRPS